jgi:hypothetical protein
MGEWKIKLLHPAIVSFGPKRFLSDVLMMLAL